MASPSIPPIPENVEDLVELPINPDVLSGAMPSEPVCPKIPGVTFPEPPDPAAFGKLVGDKLDSKADAVPESLEDLQKKAKEKKERIKNPPSATDMMNEMATQVSSAAGKAAKALEKAAIDIAAQVEKNLAAEWQKVSEGFTGLEAAMEAVRSGAVDLGALGMDALSLPGAALAAGFPGFKSAGECLKGEPGSAEEAFNKTAPELDAGVDDGRGQDGATAALAVTEQSEVVATEDGEEVSKQDVLTEEKRDEIIAAIKETMIANATKTGKAEKPITAKPVPVSANALPTHRDKKEYSQYMTLVGLTISGNEFMTNNGRALTAAEQTRYDAGLPPIFVSGIIRIYKFRRDPPGKITIAIAQAAYDASLSRKFSARGGSRAERRRKGLVEMQEIWAHVDGRTIPPEAYIPYNADDGPPPHYGWRKFGAWHPLSYNVQAGPPPEFDPNTKEPFLSQGVPIYDSKGFLYEKTEEENPHPEGKSRFEGHPAWDRRWTYSRIGGGLSVREPTSYREFS